jgi:3-phosphoshikimate 1-carboxyvinyltransferase
MASKTVVPVRFVRGSVSVPGDKSISHRAVILGALSNRTCTVDNFLEGEDCLCTVEAFRAMGVSIDRQGAHLQIAGQGLDELKAPKRPIWCGNSGTATRLLMGVLVGQPFEVALEGDASLSNRPMERVIDPLSKMGAFFGLGSDPMLTLGSDPSRWHLPLRMRGTHSVKPIQYKSPVASAQVKSAILLAGLYASGTTSVEEPSLSRDHTERMLTASGVPVKREGNRISVQGTATVRASAFQVPGDPSSAAFLLAAGLLKAPQEFVVKGVGVNPTRTGFIDIVKAMGGACRLLKATESGGEPIADIAVKFSALKGTSIAGDIIPRAIDEIPILAVLATQARGQTIISDAEELRVKESDRLKTVCEELSKMGAHIQETPDGLLIQGPTPLKGAIVQSHGDHRLAMSLAIAALVADGPTTIEDVDCVATSFPGFWDLLEQIRP